MQYISLKSIVHSVLLRKRYTMHWYLQFLLYARDIARESYFDDNHNIVNTAVLELNSVGYAKLPKDYMDWVHVGITNGQFIKPLAQGTSLNRLSNVDDSGAEIKYPDVQADTYHGYLGQFYSLHNVFNDFGENIGREFGGVNYTGDLYQIFPEKGIIQCSQNLGGGKIVMQYISNGCCIHGTVGVHPYMQQMIEAYILWKYEEDKRAKNLGVISFLKNEYVLERQKLRLRLSPLLPNDIVRIIQKNYHALPK